METISKKENTPVSPYDDSQWDRYSLYDNMPFVFDSDLNVEKIFTRFTGNLIKYYRCKIIDPFVIKHK